MAKPKTADHTPDTTTANGAANGESKEVSAKDKTRIKTLLATYGDCQATIAKAEETMKKCAVELHALAGSRRMPLNGTLVVAVVRTREGGESQAYLKKAESEVLALD